METFLKKNIFETTFEELEKRTYEVVHVVEMLCEICEKPMNRRETFLRKAQISTKDDYQNIITRATVHDRADIDLSENKIYFYDHDFPGDVHLECV